MFVPWLTAAAIALSQVSGSAAFPAPAHAPKPSNSETSITVLFNNTLDFTQDFRALPFIILNDRPRAQAAAACAALNENLLDTSTVQAHMQEVQNQLAYQAFAGYRSTRDQGYYLSDGVVVVSVDVNDGSSTINVEPFGPPLLSLPLLCTNAQAIGNSPESAVATVQNELIVESNTNTYIGYRNQKSLRFLGIPYAPSPTRWVHSAVNPARNTVFNATAYGSECAQIEATGSEDCLFLNIQTPYLPQQGDNDRSLLRPVIFWIHGGAFTGGTGAVAGSDGGQLASREDLVTVTINYRLSTLGFLCIPGTDITGNYGIGDQVTALEWTIANIAAFGGDPNRITIIGESAGAGSVRTLLGSPKAIGKFQGAIAMSNLGGGVMPSLGFFGDFATTYSSYFTIEQAFAASGGGNGQTVLAQVGCPQSTFPTIDDQITCLKGVSAFELVDNPANSNNVFRYVVQDDLFVNTEQLDVSNHNGSTAHVPVMFGNARDDGASFCTFNRSSDDLATGLAENLPITVQGAEAIIASNLFPLPNPSSGNLSLDIFNVTSRISTDIQFRCVDQATVWGGVDHQAFPVAYYFQMDRTYSGGFDPNDVGNAPVEPGFPNGDPELPYFRVHAADMPNVFGDIFPIRDNNDLIASQLISGYFASFARSANPNVPVARYNVLGYTQAAQAAKMSEVWLPVTSENGPMKLLDFVSTTAEFQDIPQCAFLGYSTNYYADVAQDRG